MGSETTTKFKLGDRVRIHDCEGSSWYNNKIGTVIDTGRIKRNIHHRWDYLCAFEGNYDYPFGPLEMERIYTKGQQLLFAFMSE